MSCSDSIVGFHGGNKFIHSLDIVSKWGKIKELCDSLSLLKKNISHCVSSDSWLDGRGENVRCSFGYKALHVHQNVVRNAEDIKTTEDSTFLILKTADFRWLVRNGHIKDKHRIARRRWKKIQDKFNLQKFSANSSEPQGWT